MKSLSNSIINKIKKELRENIIDSASSYLSTALDYSTIRIFREQKLLLFSPDHGVLANTYKDAVLRLTTGLEQEFELNYLTFVETYLKATTALEVRLKASIETYLGRSLKEFLFIINTALEHHITELNRERNDSLVEKFNLSQNPEIIAEISETLQLDLKGYVVDTYFAEVRLINLFAKWQYGIPEDGFIGIRDPDEWDRILNAIYLASNINCYQYALDKLSFGEWAISNISLVGNKGSFIFINSDVRLEKARDFGIKRNVSSAMLGRKYKGWLQTSLKQFALDTLSYAWAYYNNLSEIQVNTKAEFSEAKKEILRCLDQLDVDDELLVEKNVDNKNILTTYTVALTLVCFSIAARNLKGKSNLHLFKFTCPEIPELFIKEILTSRGINKDESSALFNSFICQPPLSHHLDIFQKPFLRDKSGKIFALDNICHDNWTSWVKVFFMKGGKAANIIGRAWEVYINDLLKMGGWDKVAGSVKIKKERQLLTDVDILAKRGNLLLVIQVKVYYGTGINVFDQWKFKSQLAHGISQAKIAVDAIKSDYGILAGCFTKQELQDIDIIKPLVMTNCHLFNGWEFDHTHVMSTSSLLQLINGATVEFTDINRRILYKKKYFESETMTTKELLEFIELPLDWRIGNPKSEIVYHEEELTDAILHFPIVRTNSSANSIRNSAGAM